MRLIFLGAPGVGKGTQADLLSKETGMPHISTGDIFRDNIKRQTELGKLAKSYIDQGGLVPDEVTNDMVKDRLKEEERFILDGYPRTINQADFLAGIQDIDMVINFTLPESEIIRRISGRRTCKACGSVYHIMFNPPKAEGVCDKCAGVLIQRSDEMPETVRQRLDVYSKQTEPLIEYYKEQGLLVEIDAAPQIDQVFKELRQRTSA